MPIVICLSEYLIYFSKEHTFTLRTKTKISHFTVLFENNALSLFAVLSGEISKPIRPHGLV